MKVTAVCPVTADRLGMLHQVVRCFLDQTFTDSELLFVVDGPCMSMISFSPTSRVRVEYLHGPQRTVGAKRNAANEKARGEIICHFDSDDWSHPWRIADQCDELALREKKAVGYHDLLYYRVDDRSFWRYNYPGKGAYATGTSLCYLKSWWEKHRFDNGSSVGEDVKFSDMARAAGELYSTESRGFIVARAHGRNTFRPRFGESPFLRAEKKSFPREFLETLCE